MEEDKKKRKNKKKKNKQATKPTENVTFNARESTSESQSHGLEKVQSSNGQLSGVINSSNDVGGHMDVDTGGNHANDSDRTNLAEADKHFWLDREASFQEKLQELEAEKDAQIQTASSLEEKIKQLLKEKAENAQNEASEREKVKQLYDEKNASVQNEAFLEQRIKQLLKEKDENAQKEAIEREKTKQLYDEKNASMQNEASLREKLMQLEKEKDALSLNEGILEQKILQLQKEVEVHLQKEANLEVKILQLEGEKDSWLQKEVHLQEKTKQMEKERDSWVLKEKSANESVASLTNEITKLRAQVIELEQSRENLFEEKQQLTQAVSSLQLQINNLESSAGIHHSSGDKKVTSEDGGANEQIEAARALIEKLITENSELVEKVNELYAELDRRGVRKEHFSFAGSVPEAVTNHSADSPAIMPNLTIGADGNNSTGQATDSISETNKVIPISGSAQFLENVIVEDHSNGDLVKVNDGHGHANSSEIIEAEEIVQIPLDDSEIKETNLEVPQVDEKTDVLLTDAPLIGAPFRLISFVARYVSGADLVDKNTGQLGI